MSEPTYMVQMLTPAGTWQTPPDFAQNGNVFWDIESPDDAIEWIRACGEHPDAEYRVVARLTVVPEGTPERYY